MKPSTLLSVFTLFAGLPASGVEQEPAMANDRLQGWRGDLDFLQAAVGREHYLFRTNPVPESFRKIAGELKGTASTASDLRMLAGLQRLMTTLGDGHCYATPSPKFIQRLKAPPDELPLRLHAFSDGLFVIDTHPGFESWVGRRITRVGSVQADEALRRVAGYVPRDNLFRARWRSPGFLGYPGYLEAIGCVGPDSRQIPLGFVSTDGTESVAPVSFVPMQMAARPPLVPSRLRGAPEPPPSLRHASSNFWFEAIPGRGATYLQFTRIREHTGKRRAAQRFDGNRRKKGYCVEERFCSTIRLASIWWPRQASRH